MAYNIGPVLSVKGEQEYGRAMKAVRETMKYVKAEAAAATSVYDKNEKSVDALTTTNSNLKKALDVQRQAVKAAEDALANMRENGVDPSSTAYKSMEANLNNAKATMNATEREIRDNEKALKGLAEETETTDKKQIQFAETLKKVGEVAGKTVVVAAKAAAAAIAAISAAAIGAAKAIWDMGKEAGEYADYMLTFSQTLGLSVETLQEYEYAARFVDVEMDVLARGLSRVTRAIGAAVKQEEDHIDILGGLKVAIRGTSGELLSGEEIFYSIIDTIGELTNATEREVAAQEIFGKSYQDLQPLINAGSQSIRDYAAEARAAGLIMSEEVMGSLGDFDDAMQRIDARFLSLKRGIAVTFLPSLESAANGIADIISTISTAFSDGIQPEDIRTIGNKISTMLLDGLKGIAQFIPEAVEVLSATLSEVIRIAVELLPEVLPILADGAMQLLSSLIDTVLENAEKIGNLAADLVIMFVEFLAENLPSIIEAGVMILTTLALGISERLPDLIPVIVDAILTITDALIDNLDILIPATLAIILALVDGLIKALPKLIEYTPKIIIAIADELVKNLPAIIMTGVKVMNSLHEGLIRELPNVLAWATQINDWIAEKIREGIYALFNVGAELISGLWQGIQSQWAPLISGVADLGNSLVNTFKGVFGIASPSKVFAELGGFMADGLGIGFKDAMKGVSTQISAAIPIKLPKMQSGGGLTINVHMTGGTPEAGRQIGSEIARQLRYRGVLYA